MNSVRNRLVLLFFAITASAIGFIYLYVVPQLRSSLTAEKLGRLEADAAEGSAVLSRELRDAPSQPELRDLTRRLAQGSGARLTVLGVRSGTSGLRPDFVVADSEIERTALLPSYPAALAAIDTGAQSTAVERVGGERLGETAVPLALDGDPLWVAVSSTPLADVEDNVALIQRQILIAGLIALAAALAAGWLAARGHARRLRRLEEAAERVAEGDFSSPIPVDQPDEVGQLAATLEEMRLRLARLDGARKEFIANASHELRTPIFSLGGFVELLEEDDPDPAARAEFVSTMRGQIDRLRKLTTDLLDLSKMDADAMSVRAEPVDLTALARSVVDEFGPAAEVHGSVLSVDGDGAVRANGDPGRIAQIVRILIDNALTHNPEGTEIRVTSRADQDTAVLEVRDAGPGISPADREAIFERFFTADDVSGSGLGLAIARELARLMGGDLTLTSRRGRNVFSLRLRAAAAPA